MNTRTAWSKKDKTPVLTARHVAIAEGRLIGKTMKQIADDLGDISVSGVSNALRRQPVKALIEELRSRLIEEALSQSVENVKALIDGYQDPIAKTANGKTPPEALQKREHGFNACLKIMEAAGLLPVRKKATKALNADSPALSQSVAKIISLQSSRASLPVDTLKSK